MRWRSCYCCACVRLIFCCDGQLWRYFAKISRCPWIHCFIYVFCFLFHWKCVTILKRRKQHNSIRFTNLLSAAIHNYLFLTYGCKKRHVFFDSKIKKQQENFKILKLKKLFCPPSMFSSGLLWTYGFSNTKTSQTTGNRSNTIKFVVCCGEEETRSEDYGD